MPCTSLLWMESSISRRSVMLVCEAAFNISYSSSTSGRHPPKLEAKTAVAAVEELSPRTACSIDREASDKQIRLHSSEECWALPSAMMLKSSSSASGRKLLRSSLA